MSDKITELHSKAQEYADKYQDPELHDFLVERVA